MQKQIPWWFTLIKGLITLIIGLYFISDPKNAAKSLAFYAGLMLLIGGLITFYQVYLARKSGRDMPFSYFSPMLLVLSGLVLLFMAEYALFVFALTIGIWILIDGITQIRNGDRMKRFDLGMGRFLVFMGVVSVGLSLLIIANPQGLINFVSIIFGIVLSVSGLFLIGMGISNR